jgi:hypothetical protein
MISKNIQSFAHEFFNKYRYTTVGDLQRFIHDRPEVAKILPPEDVENVLEELCFDKFLYTDYDKDYKFFILRHKIHGL